MSLHDDFGMYYNNTYIGVTQNNGKIFPMWVDNVSNDSDLFNLRRVASHLRQAAEHGEDAYNALVFNGSIWNGRNGGTSRSEAMSTGNIVFELPDPKYIKVGTRYHWFAYRANRSTKKGLCERRINSNLRLSYEVAYSIFNDEPDENVIGRIFLKNGDKLDYKGVPVGNLNGNNVTLYTEAAHLASVLQKEWPECQVTIEQADQ